MEFEIPGDSGPSSPGGREDFSDLRAQIERERQERWRAERQLLDLQASTLDGHLQKTEQTLDYLEQAQAEALSDYDGAKAAKLVRETIEKQNELERLRGWKAQLEQQRTQPMTEEDRIDAQINSLAASQRARDYVNAHRDEIFKHGNPEAKTTKLIAAHWDAVAEGIQPDTDAYFRHIDSHMGFDGSGGSVRTSSGAGRKVVRLSKDEKEMCDGCGLDYADYAKQRDEIAAGRSNVQFSRDLGGPYKINAGR